MAKKIKKKKPAQKDKFQKHAISGKGKQSTLINKNLSSLKFNTLALLVIIFLGFIAYSTSLNGEMIYDDLRSIATNDDVHDMGNMDNIKKWINPNHRYFAYFTFAINYSIHQDEVFGYHLFNLIIHIIYSFFVFLLAKLILSIKLFDNDPQRKKTGLLALFIALICLLHPIQTQAVSYIVQRMASMATMFYIMSVYFYGRARLEYVNQGLKQNVILFYLFSLISGILGILTKQIVATLPAALLLFELYFVRNKDGKLFKKYLIIASSLIFLSFLLILFGGYLPKETENITRSEYLFTQTRVIVKYIQLLFLPFHQALDYYFPISRSLFEWKVILSSLVIIALFVLAIFTYRRKHLVSFGIFYFFVTLLVESSLIPIIDVIFEHRLYLPIFGFSLIIVTLIWDLFSKKHTRMVIVFFVALNVVYFFASYERNKVWKSQISLWTDNIEKYPNDVVSYMNRAYSYNEIGKYQEAILDYNRGIEIDSNNYQLYINRGLAHKILRKYELAVQDYTKAIEKRKPENYQPYLERGILYTDYLTRYNEGIKDFKTYLLHNQDNLDVTLNIAIAYYKKQDFDSALVYCNKAINISPDDGKSYYITAITYAASKKFDKAYEYANQAIALGYPVKEDLMNRWSIYANNDTETGQK